jgi:hypothetical protein
MKRARLQLSEAVNYAGEANSAYRAERIKQMYAGNKLKRDILVELHGGLPWTAIRSMLAATDPQSFVNAARSLLDGLAAMRIPVE